MEAKEEDKIVLEATDLDVKLGRGKACQLWSGNQRYRKIVEKHQKQFHKNTSNQGQRPAVDKDIFLGLVLKELGPDTRFLEPLQPPKVGFAIISEKRKNEKIRQALREKNKVQDVKASRKRSYVSAEDERRLVEVSLRIGGDRPSYLSKMVLGDSKKRQKKQAPSNERQNGSVLDQQAHLLVQSPLVSVSPVSVQDWACAARTAIDALCPTSSVGTAETATRAALTFPTPASFPILNCKASLPIPIQPLIGPQGALNMFPQAPQTEGTKPTGVAYSSIQTALSKCDSSAPPTFPLETSTAHQSPTHEDSNTKQLSPIKARSKAKLLPPATQPTPAPGTSSSGVAVARLAGLGNATRAVQIPKHIQALFDYLQGLSWIDYTNASSHSSLSAQRSCHTSATM